MSKKKITRLHRPTAGKATWTDAEVLALVDAVLVARDTELAQRIRNVLGSRYGVGAGRYSVLSSVRGLSTFEMEQFETQLGRSLTKLEEDPTSRRNVKRLVAIIGKEMAGARAKGAADRVRRRLLDPHEVSA